MSIKKVLHVTSELSPYFNENPISLGVYELAKQVFSQGGDVRIFMPKFGIINERRYQLHEVIRLSGMNLIINDLDQPLVIKVASLPGERMQVYFIDNQEYFKRKNIYRDEKGNWFEDNDERAVFFAKGVLETIKKLNWVPDIIHVHGWMSSFLPIYIKENYAEDPFFSDVKIVYSLYSHGIDGTFSQKLWEILEYDNIKPVKKENFTYLDLMNKAMECSDIILKGEENLLDELEIAFNNTDKEKCEYFEKDNVAEIYEMHVNQR